MVIFFVFLLFIFCLLGVILSLFRPCWLIFGVGLGPQKICVLFVYRLTSFVFYKIQKYDKTQEDKTQKWQYTEQAMAEQDHTRALSSKLVWWSKISKMSKIGF